MTKSILCAVDFSDASFHALRWAVAVARKFDAHLTVLNTYRLTQPGNGEEVIKMKRMIEEKATDLFLKIENDILKDQGISFDFKSEVGFVRDRVEDHARKKELLFFVIGKNSSVMNRESLNELIDRINIPLVIVP